MIVAHAIGGIRDLPVPGIVFLYGGAVVLGLSFIGLGVLWHEPRLEDAASGRPLPPWLQRILLSGALRVVLGIVSVAIYAVVLAAAFFGVRDADRNLAPVIVWIIFWLGLVPVTLVLGNVWSVLSPLRAIADAVAWAFRSLRWKTRPYPEWLGRWPAAALLFCFASMELVSPEPADPRHVATALVVYSLVTWAGMAVYGRRAWLENGEAFNVYFGLFGHMAPFAVREEEGRREIVARPPFAGLSRFRPGPGAIAMVSVMLGSVGFDSITRTSSWRRFATSSLTSQGVRIPVELIVLAAVVGFVSGAYLVAIHWARRSTGAGFALAPRFLASLVPIALVYAIAHYVTLLVGQGQLVIPLASDPLGKGWNLFGSAHFEPNLKPLTSHEVWYTQVGVLVCGHVLGLVLAHDRSVSLFRGAASLRSQYAMLTLMVMYTCGGLYLLSSP